MRGADYSLATHQWVSGVIDPKGFLNIESFRLEGMMPVWTYALADALLEKRVWMKSRREYHVRRVHVRARQQRR